MTKTLMQWSKTELKIYILLLCANADCEETKQEMDLIKSKIDETGFDRIYKIFCEDDEDQRFDTIEYVIGRHEFSPKELGDLKKEVLELFHTDDKFLMKERYLEQVLDNMLY